MFYINWFEVIWLWWCRSIRSSMCRIKVVPLYEQKSQCRDGRAVLSLHLLALVWLRCWFQPLQYPLPDVNSNYEDDYDQMSYSRWSVLDPACRIKICGSWLPCSLSGSCTATILAARSHHSTGIKHLKPNEVVSCDFPYSPLTISTDSPQVFKSLWCLVEFCNYRSLSSFEINTYDFSVLIITPIIIGIYHKTNYSLCSESYIISFFDWSYHHLDMPAINSNL